MGQKGHHENGNLMEIMRLAAAASLSRARELPARSLYVQGHGGATNITKQSTTNLKTYLSSSFGLSRITISSAMSVAAL